MKIFAPIIYINPFVGIIMNMRKISMYGVEPDFYLLGVNLMSGLIILLIGIIVYKRFSHKALELL